MTSKKERISYARVFVEVDLAKDLVNEVKINLLNGKTRTQYVSYESFPKYYPFCKIIGRSGDTCKKAQANQEDCGKKEKNEQNLAINKAEDIRGENGTRNNTSGMDKKSAGSDAGRVSIDSGQLNTRKTP